MHRESPEIPTLIAVSGPLAGQTFPLAASRLTIGRDHSNDVHLRDLATSRHHCAIETRDGRLFLRDLESRHGTFVNGVPVGERFLEHGDRVTVGGSLFLVQIRDETPEEESGAVLLEEGPWSAETTIHLAAAPASFFRLEEELPAEARVARDLQALLRIANTLHEIRATARSPAAWSSWRWRPSPPSGPPCSCSIRQVRSSPPPRWTAKAGPSRFPSPAP